MANGIGLPPDIQEQIGKGRTVPQGMGGIGGAAHENAGAARARNVAVNEGYDDAAEEEIAAPPSKVKEIKDCPSCSKELEKKWAHCPSCGMDLLRSGAAAKLGVTFTEEDVQAYLFKGFVVRELKILGRHKILVKTSQPEDLEAIDEFIMNGDWSKDNGKDKKISDMLLRQKNELCITASGVMKLDGETLGATLEDRVNWLNKRGSALVDMIRTRVILFNQAFTQYIEEEDAISGS